MSKTSRIPLFPLDVVLLPAMPLPLHIFEPRYKKMIGECWNEHRPFGLILATDQAMATIGCAAEIVQKIRDFADGRMDILTKGRRVFHLAEIFDEKEYYEGVVQYLVDEPSMLELQKEIRLLDLVRQCHPLLFGQPWPETEGGDRLILSYRVAAWLPLELKEKQELLEMRREADRRDFLLGWLIKFLPVLVERQRRRQRAGGNGRCLD